MRRSERAAVTRHRLSSQVIDLTGAASVQAPPAGWIRTVRESLGMTTRQLGRRMGVAHTSVAGLEHGEVAGTIKLETLRRAAAALECDLVYALVPRRPLTETVWTQARQRAAEDLVRSGGPALDRDEHATLVEARARALVVSNRVWG